MKKYSLILFVGSAIAEFTVQAFSFTDIHYVSKPLLMISLLLYYLSSVNAEERSNVTIAALAFSWVGDVLLLFQSKEELYFIGGLLAFLVAHLFYIFAYRQFRTEDRSKELLGVQRFRFSFPIILAGTGLITVLYAHLGTLKIPVIIYALVLMFMVLNALFRFGRTSLGSFSMVFFGATLFMISDSMIAVNKFLTPIAYSGLWIMLTYVGAQYLIIEGLIRHKHN